MGEERRGIRGKEEVLSRGSVKIWSLMPWREWLMLGSFPED